MKTVKIIVIAFLAGFAGAFACFKLFTENQSNTSTGLSFNTVAYDASPSYTPSASTMDTPAEGVDFSNAASRAIPSVVYINSISEGASYSYWDLMFGGGG